MTKFVIKADHERSHYDPHCEEQCAKFYFEFLFSLTGITGNAEDEAVTVGINKSDEERVSSASPAYEPPCSPKVFIKPDGEVQFTKDHSPGKGKPDK